LQQKAGHRSGKCPGFSPDELRVAFSIPSGSLFLVNHPVFISTQLTSVKEGIIPFSLYLFSTKSHSQLDGLFI
jgi:hypothetical protein